LDIYQRIFEDTPDALLVVDHGGCITRANPQAARMFGYDGHDLIGQRVEILIPPRFATRHRRHRTGYVAEPRARPMGAGLDLFGRRKDESEFPVDILLSPIDSEGGALVLCVVRDITERKRAEVVLHSLHEKEILLKEVHHRVKNNLAVISSLFYLQSTYTSDEPTIRLLQESQDRVRSMALVHETLYRSENFAAADFAQYAATLSEQLLRSHRPISDSVRLTTDLQSVTMGIDQAVPCGLILNELITNALKHGFPNGRSGEVHVALSKRSDGSCVLRVSDTGVGIPEGLSVDTAPSLGLRLVRSLTGQVDGQFELRRAEPGTDARLILHLGSTST
jgi:PAS domain S-box-containing protein